jgi:hypothetical protein
VRNAIARSRETRSTPRPFSPSLTWIIHSMPGAEIPTRDAARVRGTLLSRTRSGREAESCRMAADSSPGVFRISMIGRVTSHRPRKCRGVAFPPSALPLALRSRGEDAEGRSRDGAGRQSLPVRRHSSRLTWLQTCRSRRHGLWSHWSPMGRRITRQPPLPCNRSIGAEPIGVSPETTL